MVVRPLAEPTGARHSRAQEGLFQRWMQEKTPVECVIAGGGSVVGRLAGFDSYAVVVVDREGVERLVFKHALVEIRPAAKP